MDPITETVVWGVVWFFGGSFITAIIYFLGLGLGLLLASATDKDRFALVGVGVGWVGAVVWEIFVFIQVILHIVNLVTLIQAGG